MKKVSMNMLSLAVIAAFVLGVAGTAAAVTTSGVSQDVGKLRAEITMLNADANLPQGAAVISKQLSDTFRVSSSKISSLLGKNMQYGDIAATYAFAQKMPGGVTDANINRIVDMRSKAMEWDRIASTVKVNLGDVAATLSGFESAAHNAVKQAFAQSLTSGAATGGVHGGAIDEMDGMGGGATGGTGTEGDIGDGMDDMDEGMGGGATGGTGTYDEGSGSSY